MAIAQAWLIGLTQVLSKALINDVLRDRCPFSWWSSNSSLSLMISRTNYMTRFITLAYSVLLLDSYFIPRWGGEGIKYIFLSPSRFDLFSKNRHKTFKNARCRWKLFSGLMVFNDIFMVFGASTTKKARQRRKIRELIIAIIHLGSFLIWVDGTNPIFKT